MFPKSNFKPVNVTMFPKLSGVIDVIYNPIKTELIKNAQKLGVPAEGGLYMLVAQAVCASAIFLNCEYNNKVIDSIFKKFI